MIAQSVLKICTDLISILSDTSTTEYFNGKTDLKVSMDTVDCAKNTCVQLRKPSLTKSDSIDIVDCEYTFKTIV